MSEVRVNATGYRMNKIIEHAMLVASILCLVVMFLSLLLAYALRGLANLVDYHYWLDMDESR